MTEMNLPGTVAVANAFDADAIRVASLLSHASPAQARAFARAMAERTARNVEVDWHDHWKQVAALLVTEIQTEAGTSGTQRDSQRA